jgi:hypothetical protein
VKKAACILLAIIFVTFMSAVVSWPGVSKSDDQKRGVAMYLLLDSLVINNRKVILGADFDNVKEALAGMDPRIVTEGLDLMVYSIEERRSIPVTFIYIDQSGLLFEFNQSRQLIAIKKRKEPT